MRYTDLRTGNLEAKLAETGLEVGEVEDIKKDLLYYDKYILVIEGNSKGFIKIWRQQLSDPYMRVELDECDLVTPGYSVISIPTYLWVLNSIFEVPQILRCREDEFDQFRKNGFSQILDNESKRKRQKNRFTASTLINVKKALKNENYHTAAEIRPMVEKDLLSINEIFKREYPLRYRAVPLLYDIGKNYNIVFEDNQIEGLVFAEGEEDSLHIHQLIVREQSKGRGIDKALLEATADRALRHQKGVLTGTIRGNLLSYYERFGIKIDPTYPITKYIIRKKLAKQ